jgi:hypothetical protein
MTTLWSIVFIAAFAILRNYGFHSDWFAGESATDILCNDNHGYQIEFLSQEPLLIHIQNFISPTEATYFTSILLDGPFLLPFLVLHEY